MYETPTDALYTRSADFPLCTAELFYPTTEPIFGSLINSSINAAINVDKEKGTGHSAVRYSTPTFQYIGKCWNVICLWTE